MVPVGVSPLPVTVATIGGLPLNLHIILATPLCPRVSLEVSKDATRRLVASGLLLQVSTSHAAGPQPEEAKRIPDH